MNTTLPIGDYALIGNTRTGALVGRNGSIDWFCAPRFDAPAMFAALLGDADHGCWRIAPVAEPVRVTRRYRDTTLLLETTFEATDGAIRLHDLMPVDGDDCRILRVVEGMRGQVDVEMDLAVRFDMGERVPWVVSADGGIVAVAGPDAVILRSPIETHGEDLRTKARFTICEGQRRAFELAWYPSHREPPPALDVERSITGTEQWWREWSDRCEYDGQWREPVVRSLITLKALTYAPTGGIVAAPTTSLPEWIGGDRNWDYRYCWLRDATFTLYALLHGGYQHEAVAWRDWLLRSTAGDARHLQILYGLAGERRIPETEADWLPGYRGSRPVRLGNQAAQQRQLDIYGEIFDLLHVARRKGLTPTDEAWALQRHMMEALTTAWDEPDAGIWEVRSEPRHFTHSRVMAWVAVDRAIKSAERYGLEGPIQRWKHLRAEIHADVCDHGYDAERGTFVRDYESKDLDASLLLMPSTGFLPPHDLRVRGTIRAVEEDLLHDGFVRRYETESTVADGVGGREGAFLPCTFWLADAYEQVGRVEDGRRLFERMLETRNDVGLLSEELDPSSGALLGNFPQALTHVALINTATNLDPRIEGTSEHRARE